MIAETALIIQFRLHIHSGIGRESRIRILLGLVYRKLINRRSISSTVPDLFRIRINAQSAGRIESRITTIRFIVGHLTIHRTVNHMSLFHVVRKHTFHLQSLGDEIQLMSDHKVSLEINLMSSLVSHVSYFTQNILGILVITEKQSVRMIHVIIFICRMPVSFKHHRINRRSRIGSKDDIA